MMKRTGDLQILHGHLSAAAEQARLLGEAEALLSIELTIELLPDTMPQQNEPLRQLSVDARQPLDPLARDRDEPAEIASSA